MYALIVASIYPSSTLTGNQKAVEGRGYLTRGEAKQNGLCRIMRVRFGNSNRTENCISPPPSASRSFNIPEPFLVWHKPWHPETVCAPPTSPFDFFRRALAPSAVTFSCATACCR